MNLTFVGHRCCDHSPSSGYDQVCSLFPEAGWLDGPALEAGRLEWQREPRQHGRMGQPLFHVIYGDCSGKGLPALLRTRFPGARIVSSAHQPPDRLKSDRPAIAALEASDAIITVAIAQARELRGFGFRAPIYSLPHGVWTRVFKANSALAGPRRQQVLIVGSFLRDWDGARQVVGLLGRAGVRTIALGAGARVHLQGNGSSLDVLPRVSEADLATLYAQSAALFLPFLHATASNAMLEAMAAGCPVICPRLPSLVDEYLGDDADCYELGRYDTATSRILRYVHDPDARELRARKLMERAEEFDWTNIRPRFAAVYAEVAGPRYAVVADAARDTGFAEAAPHETDGPLRQKRVV